MKCHVTESKCWPYHCMDILLMGKCNFHVLQFPHLLWKLNEMILCRLFSAEQHSINGRFKKMIWRSLLSCLNWECRSAFLWYYFVTFHVSQTENYQPFKRWGIYFLCELSHVWKLRLHICSLFAVFPKDQTQVSYVFWSKRYLSHLRRYPSHSVEPDWTR